MGAQESLNPLCQLQFWCLLCPPLLLPGGGAHREVLGSTHLPFLCDSVLLHRCGRGWQSGRVMMPPAHLCPQLGTLCFSVPSATCHSPGASSSAWG
jgi:hypothetical protein